MISTLYINSSKGLPRCYTGHLYGHDVEHLMYQTQSVGVLMNTIGKIGIPLIIETLYISANYFKTLITQALET